MTSDFTTDWRRAFAAIAALTATLTLVGSAACRAAEPAYASAWASEHATKVRLIAGGPANPDAADKSTALLAGIEIALDPGWKTYWRNPGTSGVPPRVDLAGSENVGEFELRFPAPHRFVDRDGDTIGYKGDVVMPLAIVPKDPAKPVVLKAAIEYGVCKDVCIPVQSELTLTLPPATAKAVIADVLKSAREHLPRPVPVRRASDPQLKAVAIDLKSDKPSIRLDVSFSGDAGEADVFLEAPDGLWMPLPKRTGEAAGGVARFEVDLTDGADLADLKGKTIRATLVSAKGASEATFKLE